MSALIVAELLEDGHGDGERPAPLLRAVDAPDRSLDEVHRPALPTRRADHPTAIDPIASPESGSK